MSFTIITTPVSAGNRSGASLTLTSEHARAEIWPTHGFNCLSWQVRDGGGNWADLLYCAADWETNPVPTRSGHPILFPFPNRMKGGRFTFEGKEYQLPKNETSGLHAIHGFTPRLPWRVVSAQANSDFASVTGEFQLSKDAPEAVWPADARLSLTYRLTASALRVEAVVDAPDGKSLPFGLGYHPYFRLPTNAAGIDEYRLQASVARIWESQSNIPTGNKLSIPAELDFQSERPLGETVLDTLYTEVTAKKAAGARFLEVASISDPSKGKLSVNVEEIWRELLLFTPPHRQAVAIEPYTCATDAANLEAAGHAAGWMVLPAGKQFSANVEYQWQPNS